MLQNNTIPVACKISYNNYTKNSEYYMKDHKALEILEDYKKKVWPEVQSYLKSPSYPTGFKVPKRYSNISKKHWDIVTEYPKRQGKHLFFLVLVGLL